MPITFIVGGQYGSQGKGKVAHCLAVEREATIAVRTGGPDAGILLSIDLMFGPCCSVNCQHGHYSRSQVHPGGLDGSSGYCCSKNATSLESNRGNCS